MPKLIIGFTGLAGSGKDTAANYLVTKGFRHTSLSNVVRSEARRQLASTAREKLIMIGNQLRNDYGPAVLARKAMEKVAKANRVVVTAIRNPSEVEYLRTCGTFILVNLTANPEVRLLRLKRRGRKDEQHLTADELKRREKLEESRDPKAQQLHKVIAMADRVIDDNGSKEQLYARLDQFIAKF
ncbi:AAA family ATPase [Candidatus Berkelbacteria bacterium]|nr:AAA family ATPase [Candidatus Berkelbacteria bacterium]